MSSTWGKNTLKCPNFNQIFTFYGALVLIPFTDQGEIWQEIVDPWSTLAKQISLESICLVTFQGWKTAICGKFWQGGSCTQPPLLMMAKFGVLQQTHSLCLHAKFRLIRFILPPSGDENPKLLGFLDSGIFLQKFQ